MLWYGLPPRDNNEKYFYFIVWGEILGMRLAWVYILKTIKLAVTPTEAVSMPIYRTRRTYWDSKYSSRRHE